MLISTKKKMVTVLTCPYCQSVVSELEQMEISDPLNQKAQKAQVLNLEKLIWMKIKDHECKVLEPEL